MTLKEMKEKLDNISDIGLLVVEVDRLKNEVDEKHLKKYLNKIKKYNDKEERIHRLKKYEEELKAKYDYVVGIDEVGRGPLAGPVVASAVMMKTDSFLLDVDDSKKLTEKKREELYDKIKSEAAYVGVGMIDAQEIDRVNILNATFLAMEEAFEKLNIDKERTLVLIDGNMKNPHIDANQEAIIKGDSKCYSISCASIIAKVTRDRMMDKLHDVYPDYDFINNKGYGTEKHLNALKAKGKIDGIHRNSFLTKLDVKM